MPLSQVDRFRAGKPKAGKRTQVYWRGSSMIEYSAQVQKSTLRVVVMMLRGRNNRELWPTKWSALEQINIQGAFTMSLSPSSATMSSGKMSKPKERSSSRRWLTTIRLISPLSSTAASPTSQAVMMHLRISTRSISLRMASPKWVTRRSASSKLRIHTRTRRYSQWCSVQWARTQN